MKKRKAGKQETFSRTNKGNTHVLLQDADRTVITQEFQAGRSSVKPCLQICSHLVRVEAATENCQRLLDGAAFLLFLLASSKSPDLWHWATTAFLTLHKEEEWCDDGSEASTQRPQTTPWFSEDQAVSKAQAATTKISDDCRLHRHELGLSPATFLPSHCLPSLSLSWGTR